MNFVLAFITLGMAVLVGDRLGSDWPSRSVVAAAASHPSAQ
jgi:hypothetical protein